MNHYEINKELLRARMKERGCTVEQLAELLGISAKTIRSRINGNSDFRSNEVVCISRMLMLKASEVDAIFFPGSVSRA